MYHIDLSKHMVRVLCETFLRPIMSRSKMCKVKTRKLEVRSNIFFFSKSVQDYGNGSADICLGIQAAGQAGHSLSL